MLRFVKLRRPSIRKHRLQIHTFYTYNDKDHCDPHRQSPACLLAKDEAQNASCEASKVVDRNDDTLEGGRGMAERVQEILITHDTTEDSLIISKQDKCQLAHDCNGGSQLEPSSIPVVFRCFDHDA
jgi:hypothetical protein